MDATIQMQLPEDLKQAIIQLAKQSINTAIKEAKEKDGFPPYMNKTETAKYLHVSPVTLIQLEKDYPDIPKIEIEGIQRYQRKSLDAWMEQHQLNKK